MNDIQFGAAVRLLRKRRKWRQADLATSARVSQATVSRIERGHLDTLAVATVRRVLGVLDTRLDLVARWRGGDLDRAVNAGHNAMHEAVARQFRDRADWVTRPEVSFSRWGERGAIDVLAWNARHRALLVIELKTALIDAGGLIAQVDRYQRLAPLVSRELGWSALKTSCWVLIADTEANRHRLADHRTLLRGRFPVDGRSIQPWLEKPAGSIAALSFLCAARSRPDRGATARLRSGRVG